MINYKSVFELTPTPFIIVKSDAPKYTVVDANNAYLKATNTVKDNIIGKGLFEVFPEIIKPNGDSNSEGVSEIRGALRKVIRTGLPHKSGVTKYDIPVPGTDKFEEKYWNADHIPLFSADGKITHVIQHAMDITNLVHLGLKIDK